jgi:phosphoribosyl 1,2-cyclic phosphodiesterase
MVMHFTVLASGSSGNASVLEADGDAVLLDMGLGPQRLTARLEAAHVSWAQIRAVLLTHTHGDHWRERSLALLYRHSIPLFCHAAHAEALSGNSRVFWRMEAEGLVHVFEPGVEVNMSLPMRCRPFALSHDSPGTCGFRFDGPPDFFGQRDSLAYAADLGCWHADLIPHLCDVDLLALEFNHDVDLERRSGRPRVLVDRVLGRQGHLSNDDAAALAQKVLERSEPGRLRHLVQLHLSRECNRPELAHAAARRGLLDFPHVEIHTALQDCPGPRLRLGGPLRFHHRMRRKPGVRRRRVYHQPCFLGWEETDERPVNRSEMELPASQYLTTARRYGAPVD